MNGINSVIKCKTYEFLLIDRWKHLWNFDRQNQKILSHEKPHYQNYCLFMLHVNDVYGC